jgi:hypothetical protein
MGFMGFQAMDVSVMQALELRKAETERGMKAAAVSEI